MAASARLHDQAAEPFIDGLYFVDGLRWHQSRMWFSDFFGHAVYSVDTEGRKRLEAEVPNQPSGLGWLPDGRLLVVSMVDRTVLRREPDGTLVRHGDLAPWATFHGNEMVVDSQGRAYVGNFGFDLYAFAEGKLQPSTTSLVRVDPDGSSHEAAADLAFPNGSVITPDGRTLIIAESMAARLTAFEIAGDGTLSDRREWAPLGSCAPDGICLDAEGCVWVANATAPECIRIEEGGRVLDRVMTSEPCFACMLGGIDRRTLYLATAPSAVQSEASLDPKGKIEQVRVAIPGAGLP